MHLVAFMLGSDGGSLLLQRRVGDRSYGDEGPDWTHKKQVEDEEERAKR